MPMRTCKCVQSCCRVCGATLVHLCSAFDKKYFFHRRRKVSVWFEHTALHVCKHECVKGLNTCISVHAALTVHARIYVSLRKLGKPVTNVLLQALSHS